MVLKEHVVCSVCGENLAEKAGECRRCYWRARYGNSISKDLTPYQRELQTAVFKEAAWLTVITLIRMANDVAQGP
jgi:hypothetical protein